MGRVLLDVDGVILVDRRRNPRREAWMLGLPFEGLPSLEVLDIPKRSGGVAIDADWGGGGSFPAWYRPHAVSVLREVHAAGHDVVWNTSWLVGGYVGEPHDSPTSRDEEGLAPLRNLARQTGLEFVRFPEPWELPVTPNREAIPDTAFQAVYHWKVRAAQRSLDAGVDTLIVDDQMRWAGVRTFDSSRGTATVVSPAMFWGLSRRDTNAIRRWARL